MLKTIAAKAAVCGAVLITGTAPVLAGEICLRSFDETVHVHGRFIGFEEGFYVVRVHGFDVQVEAGRVNCKGDDCVLFLSDAGMIHGVG